MAKSRNILPPRRYWLKWEEEFLRQHYAHFLTEALAAVLHCTVERVLAKANSMGLHKTPELISETARKRSLEPGHGSAATRFKPGIVPANKGLRRPGWAPGRMRETQFEKGRRPHTWVPVGSYTVNTDGYLDHKVNDLPGPRHVRWKPVHRLVWEAAHGPVPDGHTVVFKPGRKTAKLELITLDAVELLTRAELMARNTIHNLPEPLRDVVRLNARLKRQIDKRAKDET